MSFSCLQLPKAQKEILEAWEWYEDKQSGLGDRFKQFLFRKIESISENPSYYPLKGKYHEALVDDFPFLIIYKIVGQTKEILIISVFHTSRHPNKKF